MYYKDENIRFEEGIGINHRRAINIHLVKYKQ